MMERLIRFFAAFAYLILAMAGFGAVLVGLGVLSAVIFDVDAKHPLAAVFPVLGVLALAAWIISED